MISRLKSPGNSFEPEKAGLLSCISHRILNPPSHEIITSAALGCQKEGYSLNVFANLLSENDLLSIFRSGQADGMILMEILTHDSRVDLLHKNNIPFVMIGRCADNTELSYVDVDINKGIADAMQHLVDLGHRNIGFITLSPTLKEKEYGFITWAVKGYRIILRETQPPCFVALCKSTDKRRGISCK